MGAMEPKQRTVQCLSPRGLHKIAYLEWGDPSNSKVLICAHGLTRCARDFDALAAAMADRYRVICPDTAGRGASDWLADPMLYGIPQYVADMVTLSARLDVEQVDWVGTSMGGLIGMALAAQPGTPIAKSASFFAATIGRGPAHAVRSMAGRRTAGRARAEMMLWIRMERLVKRA